MFQSLFWWICHFDRMTLFSKLGEVEFQSLFWWICHFDSQRLVAFSSWRALFQSLFWWICHFDGRRPHQLDKPGEFQSLFWWICHFDPELSTMGLHYLYVSILVLMDLSFRRNFVGFVSNWCLFQSLFWWICHFDRSRVAIHRAKISFNPCFDGFVISTLLTGLYSSINRLFQSLFWWICHFDGGEKIRVKTWGKFQSLFWWICHFDLNVKINVTKGRKCFNPCFDGFVISTLGWRL